jgi:hypothetical protein
MDLRDPVIDLENNPYSPWRYGYSATSPADDVIRRAYLDHLQCHVDQFLVQDPELGQYMPNAKIVPRALELDKWPHAGLEPTDKPIVVHGPSNQLVKGTKFVLEACEELKDEGLNFELKLITGMAHEEAVSWYRRSDILVDQLHIGAYGVLAMEGMALGKAVMCYLREDLFKPVYGDMPIVNCNPDNFKDQLRTLIKDYEMRKDFSLRARAFVEKHHDVNNAAPLLKSVYEDVMAAPQRMPDSNADLKFMGLQYGGMERQVNEQRALANRAEQKADAYRQQIEDNQVELISARDAQNDAAALRLEVARYKKLVENAQRDRDAARERLASYRETRAPTGPYARMRSAWRNIRKRLGA